MTQATQLALQAARQVGLRVREQDIDALTQWITDRCSALGLRELAAYSQLLEQDDSAGRRERELLTVRSTTGETFFFRDQGQIDLLTNTLLPALMVQRARQRKLRLWSAGCAAGEEAYTLAMLVSEMGSRLDGWQVSIIGTDINSDALKKARLGLYGEWSFRATDARRKALHFEPTGAQWQIKAQLRGMVEFRQLDLLRDPFDRTAFHLNEVDLIVCRNVFIYLEPAAVSTIAAKFNRSMATNAYLLTGHNELFGHDTSPLRVTMYPQSAVFQKLAAQTREPGLVKAMARLPTPSSPLLQKALPSAPIPGALEPLKPREPNVDSLIAQSEHLLQAAWRDADDGRHDPAQRSCLEAIALTPFDPRPYFLLAQLAQERGDMEQTLTWLNKVVYLDPGFIAAYLELGALYAQTEDDTRSRRMYATARLELAKLPADAKVVPYVDSPAAEILAYVDRLLAATLVTAPQSGTRKIPGSAIP